ncbi:uncharacterized protein EDB93DRAFT_1310181 [Suillus bovinus]|uniref:uncharacterized protein n=1 Tax=Suillus bovinus TaxID=48563 RepID=UPI001B87FA0B|nr:uncharacterized protein EDB93DRAFT_1310181 [Suillus bovinus]KAG2156482.1 hypothetical protein EDB93DRAFT_1310181 [Suillus bovinus]
MPQQPADSDDEFPDDIGQLDLSNVPGLQEIPLTASVRPQLYDPPPNVIVPAPPLQSSTSPLISEYDCDDEIDESTIAALDALEAQFAHGQPRPGASLFTAQSSIASGFHTFFNLCIFKDDIDSTARAAIPGLDDRKRGLSSPQTSPASKKGKTSAEDSCDTANKILEGLENEIMCPICFDIMVAAHLCNPCGHSCCGECAQGWISQNKTSPACAVCRAALSTTKPLLLNYSLDAVIQQYIRALAISGRLEWQEKGDRLAEWRKRHDKWTKIAQANAVKAKETAYRRRRYQDLVVSYQPPVYEALGSYDDEDDEVVQILPRRRIGRR